MKKLLILRHGKSDWDAGSRGDHERPLNQRGTEAAATIGRFLARTGRQPDLVVSSTAVRARSTAELANQAGSWGCDIELERALYGSSVATVLSAAGRHGGRHDRLLIAGHEPTSSATVEYLTGAQVRFPTAGLACIHLPIDSWDELNEAEAASDMGGRSELAWFVIPRLLSDIV